MILYGMLYAAAVGLPILLAALVSSALLRRSGRAERGVWLGALLLALALPVFALTRAPAEPPVDFPATPPSPVATGLIGLPTTLAVPDVSLLAVPVARTAFGLDEVVVGLWLLTSLVLAIRWAVASARLARLTRSCPVETVDGVRVRVTTDLGPAVAGWLRPRILVPSWLMSLPEDQRALVLLHEEEHLRAGDPLLFTVSRLSRILAPWNPVVWMLSARLLRAIELDCDRRVLSKRPDVRAYGTTLLTVSARDPGALVGAAAFAETDAPLRQRILAMTTPPSTVSVLGLFTALVLGMLLLLGAFEVPVPTVARSGPERAGAEEEQARVAQEAAAERIASLEAQLEASEAGRAAEARRAATALALLEEATRARTGTIAGTVRDASTEEPIANAQVFVRDTGIGGLTNDRGRFLLLNVPAGDLQVVAQRIGFGEVAHAVTVEGGATSTVDVAMQETAVEVEGVLVTGEVTDTPGGLPGLAAVSGDAAPLIYIDGVRVEGIPPGRLDEAIRAEEIDRVEVLKADAAVALFGEEARAGVIRIFRKQPQQDARAPRENPSGGPVFTPFTVAPSILNRAEVVRAMREAYPPALRAEGIGGTVHVWFFIAEDGTVQDYRIRSGSGHDALDDAALEVAGVYRFSPALNRDERVAVWVELPITFLTAG